MEIQLIQNNLRVVRDDIFPFLGGGNKGRKIRFIEKDIVANGCNAVVTTGGIQSNHCRALSILAAQNGWKCTLVLHGSKSEWETQNGNALIMRQSGAEAVFCEASEIGKTMDEAMGKYTKSVLKPYYVYGGGHTLEGGLAYIEAIKELREYCDEHSWQPDYIFHASGTGSTQAGILAGLDKYGLKANVIGISVARKREPAEKVVSEFYAKLCTHYKIKARSEVIVLDDYLCDGYEQSDEKLREISSNSIKNFGFALDTTYSGKAFYGMQEYVKTNNIKGNILFWHTGGLFNFLAQ